jgi:two-component system, OmpR family, sensor kinase
VTTAPAAGTSRGRPLARRLALSVTALVAVVLAVAGVTVIVSLRGFLVERVDQQLSQIVAVAPAVLFEATGVEADEDRPVVRPRNGALATPDALAVAVAPGGQVLSLARGPASGDEVADPAALAAAARQVASGRPSDVVVGDDSYRVLVRTAPEATYVVALPLDQVRETVSRLVLAEVLVGLGALLMVALGSSLVVRRGLRPLQRIAAEARGLSTVDLAGPRGGERDSVAVSLRRPGDPAEVADLGDALEGMLGHIDSSLTARDEAEDQLRQFVADASHELRTPLQSIRGYAELTRRGMVADPDQAATAAARIEAEAVRMGRLVDDLLLLARLDQGRPLADEPVDLVAIAADSVADSRAAGESGPVALAVPDAPVVVRGDSDRLRQVLANLVANARMHTPPGTAVRVEVAAVPGGGARVVVADAGPGIPAHALPHVFDRFYRADPGRSRDRGGSGLGLAMVRSIVAAHGGTVDLRSDAAGTVVEVVLPSQPPPRREPSTDATH